MSMHNRTRSAQAGFALVLALLSLMLLTVLGLTLTTTTSTELQIAANYSWGQQAYYNAEAGMETARGLLASIGDGSIVLPAARDGVTWTEATGGSAGAPTPAFARSDAYLNPTRNFENSACDGRGNGAGYGAVLDDGGTAGLPLQNVTTIFGQSINGTFTVWVRRDVTLDDAGLYRDDPNNDSFIITAEGTAPFAGNMASQAFSQQRRAVRVIESRASLTPPCQQGNAEKSPTGFCRCCPPLP